MPIQITMPRLSDTMEQGTVIKWNVAEGDEVTAGDMLADIETDKATMELQAYDDGTLAKIVAEEGATVEVGQVIAVLAEDDEDVEEVAAGAGSAAGAEQADAKQKAEDGAAEPAGDKSETGTAVAEPPAEGTSRSESTSPKSNGATANGAPAKGDDAGGRIFASPLARKIADEKGVDLSNLSGSGPSGRIVKADVEAAADGKSARQEPASERPEAAPAPAPLSAEGAGLEARSVELSNMRRTIAKRLVESKQTVPHYQVTVSADMGPLMDLREQLNEQLETQGVKLSVNDFIVRAAALAMHQHPHVNSRWNESTIDIQGDVNVGVAIALPAERGGGLVVATLRNADRLGLRQISAETRRLAKKAREKGLSVEEMADSTFTISNLGMFGVDHFTAIINPPNVAILAVGATLELPVVKNGEIAIGRRMSMTMSSDHRVIDGAMAAEYLSTVKGLLEAPATLLV